MTSNGRDAVDELEVDHDVLEVEPDVSDNDDVGHPDVPVSGQDLRTAEDGTAAEGEGPVGLRRLVKEAANWRELRETPYGIRPALIFAFVTFFQVLDTTAFTLAGPEIVREFDLDITTFIGIRQIVGFFAIFAGLALGWYTDRVRRLPWFIGGTIASGFFSMVSAGATSVLTLGVPRVLDDVADEASTVPQNSLLADYYPFEARGRVFAMVGMFRSAGTLIALPLVGAIVTYISVRVAFVSFGVPIFLMGIVAAFFLREPVRGYFERKSFGADEDVARTEDEPRSFGEGWRTTWGVRTVRRGFIGNMITVVGVVAFITFLPFLFNEVYGLNAFERGLVGIPAAIATLVGGFFGGGFADALTRRSPARVITVYAAFVMVLGVAIVGIAFTPPLPLLIALFAFYSFGFGLSGPAILAVISQVIPPDIRTQGLQIFGLSALPALVFGLGVYGAIFTNYGYTTLFLAMVPTIVVGGLVTMSAGRFFDLDRRSAFAAALAAEEWRRARAARQGKLLVCRDVDVEYDGVQVLFGVDFDVEEGETIALLGTNGAGKSTLLRAISGTHEASGGAIVFDGRDITHMPPHEVARRGVIHMPGGRGVFPGLSVEDNVLLGTWMIDDDAEKRTRLAEVYEIFPVLKTRAGTLAGSLSGGEQQQLSLAQAFLGNPRLLMIDELSLGLAPAVVAELLDKVREIRERGTTVIIVEQSVNVALTIAERAIFMEKGEVKFFGRTEELLQRPDILRAVYVKGTGALTEGPSTARRSVSEQRRLDLERAAPALEVRDVVKRYGGVTALAGVSFAVAEGAVLGLIGPNGSGKTTLFDVVSGFQRADEGHVLYRGKDVTDLAPAERARKGLVRRFQDARLFPSLTTYETLLVALDQRLDVKNAVVNAAGLPHARRAERRLRARADALIELLELGAYRDKFIKELSTGLRRIVDIACTLASDPRVLLLDEPSSGIAQSEAEGLAPLLRRVRHETGCTILIIEHDMPLLSRVADELIALESGTFVTRGTPADVLNDERVIESYLGSSEEAVQRSGGLG